MMKPLLFATVIGLAASSFWWFAAAEAKPLPAGREGAQKLFNDGNFNDAYRVFRELATNPKTEPDAVGGDLSSAVDCLMHLGRVDEIDELLEATGERLPVIVSGTVTDASGRILSGQTVGAFWHSVRHAKPLAVGLNCALGAALMRPYIEELAKVAADTWISCYPNAGLPNPMSETGFDETPEVTAGMLAEFAQAGFVNIVGGCCGTTPAHIAAIAKCIDGAAPRKVPSGR